MLNNQFCESFQDFCKEIKQIINIRGFPSLSRKYCNAECFIKKKKNILSQLLLPENVSNLTFKKNPHNFTYFRLKTTLNIFFSFLSK